MRRPRPGLLITAPLLLPALLLACGQRGDREAAPASPVAVPFPDAPVILVSIDTLRADRLPLYGYDGVETPALDALAADSILFENAWSHVPLTLPSHLSIFTGRLPNQHGVRNNLGYHFDADAHPTLAGLASSTGYHTGAAVSSYVLRAGTGAPAGFSFYDDGIASRDGVALGTLQRPGAETVRVAERWLGDNLDRPLFFLHLFEPHAPYEPAAPFRTRYGDSYDGEVATADALLGQFVRALRDLQLYDECVLVLFSDHGEGLGDHGEQEHGVFLYRESLHVPLLLKLPHGEGGGRREARTVQLVDILPTVGALVGLSLPADLPGVSLLERSSDELEPRPVYAESLFPRIHLGWSELYSVVDGRFQFVSAPRPELYDLESDPGERTNLVQEERAEARRLYRILEGMRSAITAPAAVSAAEAERLAALGYLGSTAPHAATELPDPKDRIDELEDIRRAFALDAQGRPAAAALLLRELLRRNPRAMDARSKLALTLDELGRTEEALAVYRQGLELDPTLAADYALSIASLLRKLGQLDEAKRYAELALSSHGPRARVLLSKLALDRGDLQSATATATTVAGDPSSELAAQVVLAQVEIRRGRLEEALARLDAAENGHRYAEARPVDGLELIRGDALARLERPVEAEQAFLAEIRDFPRKAEPYARLAVLYRVQGRWGDTHGILDTLVERIPTAPAYLLAARTLEALGDPDGAARFRRRAAALPQEPP